VDKAGNAAAESSVVFSVTATVDSLKTAVDRFYKDGSIKNKGVYKQLMHELTDASGTDPEETSEALNDFIHEVKHNGRQITKQAADLLIADASWVIVHLPDTSAPTIKIYSPQVESYLRYQTLKLNFSASDKITGVKEVTATLDGVSVTNGQKLNLYTMALGNHTLTVNAVDYAGNVSTKSVTFKVVVKIHHH
jgi:hypothetical protein